MEPFNYLSVLISIILGLAIAQVLQSVRGLVLTRSKVKLYTPTIFSSRFRPAFPALHRVDLSQSEPVTRLTDRDAIQQFIDRFLQTP